MIPYIVNCIFGTALCKNIRFLYLTDQNILRNYKVNRFDLNICKLPYNGDQSSTSRSGIREPFGSTHVNSDNHYVAQKKNLYNVSNICGYLFFNNL